MRARLIVFLLAASLSACETMHGQHEQHVPPPTRQTQPLPTLPPIPDPVPVPEAPPAAPSLPPSARFPQSADQISSAAVTSLMKKAREYRSAGQPAQAAGVLERALRIEPRNYFAWSALGQAYLAQKNYAQAESMALRSNSLARGNPFVLVENWKTIASAREARGDAEGALQASAQLATIQAQLETP